MTTVFKKTDYEEMINDARRMSFPRMITTDGIDVDLEWDNGTDQFEYDMVPVQKINCLDNIPSFAFIDRARKLVKRGLSGEKLWDALR